MSQNLLALVIEDHPDQAFVFESALKKAGCDTEVIADGQIAQQRLTEIVPMVIILDLHIPNVAGDELLRQISADPRLEKTRVILATADALLAESLREQASMVLLKPISFAQLAGLMTRICAREKEKETQSET